jgi:hypothetical protein
MTNDILKNFKINEKNFRKISCGKQHNLILINGLNNKKKQKFN